VPPLPLHRLQNVQAAPGSPRLACRQHDDNSRPGSPYVIRPRAIPTHATPASTGSMDTCSQPVASGHSTVAAAAARIRERASSAGAPRCAAFPGYAMRSSGRTATDSSGSSMPVSTSASTARPRSAQSRVGAYTFLSGSSSGQRLSSSRGRGLDAGAATAAAMTWSQRTGRSDKPAVATSPRQTSHRSALQAPRAFSSPRAMSKEYGSPPRSCTSPTRPGRASHAAPFVAGLATTWAELMDLISRSRPASSSEDCLAESSRPREQRPPDPGQTRQACQVFADVVNRLPDGMLRRVLAVLAEELFNAIFRDYIFSYNPREGSAGGRDASQRATSQPPRLHEDALAEAVPYSAVVQSLRDAAKDAIMRRLEFEAKCSSLNSPRPVVIPDKNNAEAQMREELRHARLLADTYQARVLELERVRIELEEEVDAARHDRDRSDAHQQKLSSEVRRLRAEAERATLQGQNAGGGGGRNRTSLGAGTNGASSRRQLLDRRSTGSNNSMSEQQRAATKEAALVEAGAPTAPSEEELPASRLRRPQTSGQKDILSRSFRSPRDRGPYSPTQTSSGTSLTSREDRATGPADAAAGAVPRPRRNTGPHSSSTTALGIANSNANGANGTAGRSTKVDWAQKSKR